MNNTYWAYQTYPCELIPTNEISTITGKPVLRNKYPSEISDVLHTYIFNTQDEAFLFANEDEAFDDCHGKESWCMKYDQVIFKVNENELEDYAPIITNQIIIGKL